MHTPLTKVQGIGPSTVTILNESGINCAEDLATIDLKTLISVPGFSQIRAQQSIDSAQSITNTQVKETDEKVATKPAKPKKAKPTDKKPKKEKPVKMKKIKTSKKDKKQEKAAKAEKPKKSKTQKKSKKTKEEKKSKSKKNK